MNKEHLLQLLHKYFNNTIEQEECKELFQYIDEGDKDILSDAVDELLFQDGGEVNFDNLQAENIFKRISADPRFAGHQHAKWYQSRWLKVAAILLVSLSFGIYFNFFTVKTLNNVQVTYSAPVQALTPIVPGSSKAILTLANGQRIPLNSTTNEEISRQAGINISKNKDGQVFCYASVASTEKQPTINRIETPKGGEFQIVLADGTKVWLNSASSLTFPDSFSGDKREVKLTGEGYFEVAKDRKKKFLVNANDATIEVLGTHFNISSYQDEGSILTTLLEGSVKLSKNNNHVILKPGQQASVAHTASQIKVSEIDVAEVMAWKNGIFFFKREEVKSVMKKVARWYDIEVEYRGNMQGKVLQGTISRFENIEKLMNAFELTGALHYKIEGRRVIIMN
jgi:transmembrane sensor